MSDDDTNERDDPGGVDSGAGDSARGFHAGVGLGVFSGVLGRLLDLNSHSSHGSPMSPGHRRTPGFRRRRGQNTDDTSSPERTERDRSDQSDEYLFDTRFDDDEFVVTADIPGATRDDLSVGIRRRTNDLVISRAGTILRRLDIPCASPEATRVWLNNGVLVVRLQPRDA